jgi:cytochrome c oxidase subunit 1
MGAVFSLIAGLIHWFPVITGLTINPSWLKVQFFIIFVGVNLTFFPIHFLGLAGIPRRYSDYPDTFSIWNVVASIGSLVSVVSVIIFVFIMWESFVRHRAILARNHINTMVEMAHSFPPTSHSYASVPGIWEKS